MRRRGLDEVDVLRLLARWLLYLNQPLLMLIQRLICKVLQAQRPSHALCVELVAAQIRHHFPIAVAFDDLGEGILNDVPDVELAVSFIKEHSTWSDKA